MTYRSPLLTLALSFLSLSSMAMAQEADKPLPTIASKVDELEKITRFLARPADAFKKTDPLPTPAGEPIGGKGGS
jgi:hypothetical protein